MLADPLTKGMKHAGLNLLMGGGSVSLIPTKHNECESKDEITMDMDA
jgi:hypothetical protein